MTQNYVTVSIKLCPDVWNDEYIILCKFIQFNLIQFNSLNMPLNQGWENGAFLLLRSFAASSLIW